MNTQTNTFTDGCSRALRQLATTAAFAAAAIGLAACGSSTAATAPHGSGLVTAVPAHCTNVKSSAPTTSTPTIAILGQTGGGSRYFDPDLNKVLAAAVNEKARVLVNGVGDPHTAPDLAADEVMSADGPNESFRKTNLRCKTAAVSTAVTSTLSGVAAQTHPDVFNALNTLAGNLKGNPSSKPVDVLLFTSLAAKGGGIDLSDPKTLANPIAAINKLAAQGLIPSCKNDRFYAVGADRGLSDQKSAQLQAFWRTYVTKCGGQLVSWTGHLAQFPITGAIPVPDTSQITEKRTINKVTVTLGSDVLFGPDSAALLPGATPYLKRLLVDAKPASASTVVTSISITGYVNPTTGADPATEQTLSTRRADAVKSWLLAHGVTVSITTEGKGARGALFPNPTSASQAAANRRVVAVINTKSQ